MSDCVPCNKTSIPIAGVCALCGNHKKDGEKIITRITMRMTEGIAGEESRADKLRPITWVMDMTGAPMVHTSCLQLLFSGLPMQELSKTSLNSKTLTRSID